MNTTLSKDSNFERAIDHMPMLIIITNEDMIVKYSNISSINTIDRTYYENIARGAGHYIGCINSFNSPKGCGHGIKCKNCKLKKIVKKTMRNLLPSDSIEMQMDVLKNNRIEKPWFKIKTIPILKNEENQIMIVMTDISEYKEMQDEILSVNNFYYSVVKYFPEMLWKTDINKKYVYFNKNWEELTGHTVEQLLEENCIIGMHQDDVENYNKEFMKAYEMKQAFRIEYRVKTVAEEYSNILSKGNPIYGENSEFAGFVGIDVDVTYDKKTNEELLRLKEAAEAANKAKSEFLANMSHEIRTPLNGIIGMTDLTLSTELTDEQKENLNVVKDCAHTLLFLINNVLDLSKIEAEKIIIEDLEFDVKNLIQKVIFTNLPKANEKYIQLHCSFDDEIPKMLIGDAHRIEQVLNNLVSNAVKFTENGFVLLKINKISNMSGIFEIKFSVNDLGLGISEDEMKYLFQSFTQVDGSITRKYGGTGLGLSISQKLVELMGGNIKVDSEKGVGSDFYFTLKLQEAKSIIGKSKLKMIGTKNLKSESILLVEDNKVNKMVTKKMLQEIGYSKIRTASNGIEALKLMENYDFDIILMDIHMPELDGIETVQIIRGKEKESGQHIPIIAITAYALKGDKEKFLSKGMDYYISKPVDINELDELLNKIQKNLSNNDTNMINLYLESKKNINENEFKDMSETIKSDISKLLIEIKTSLEIEKGISGDYLKIEKIAHDIKMKCEENNLTSIKVLAFKLELAARKKDNIKILTNLDEINMRIKHNK